jgi:hypothetical protein
MSDEKQSKKLQMEVIAKGDAVFTDREYQQTLIERVEQTSGMEAAGDIAKKLGLNQMAIELYKAALLSMPKSDWGFEPLLEKAGEKKAQRSFWQEKFDGADSVESARQYGAKLSLDEKLIQEKSEQAVANKYKSIEGRRQHMLRSWRDSENAESVFRHDMSHAVRAAVEVGNMQLLNQGYQVFMDSVIRDNNPGYLERLVDHFNNAKEKFAAKGVQLNPKEFYFDENILNICIEKAGQKNEYWGWNLAASVAKLIGNVEAGKYEERAKVMKEQYEEEQKRKYGDRSSDSMGQKKVEVSFERLVREGKFTDAFDTARRSNDVEKAKSIYAKAIEQALQQSWNPIYAAQSMAQFVGDSAKVKIYELAGMIR